MSARRITGPAAVRALAVLFALAAIVLGLAGQARAAEPGPSVQAVAYTSLVVEHSAKCVDVRDYSAANKAVVQQYTCHGDSNQQWRHVGTGQVGYVTVRAASSGKCLDVRDYSKAPGAAVQQYTCHGQPNQQWQLQRNGNGWQYVSQNSGLCLAVANSGLSNKAPLVQQVCTGGSDQRFVQR